MASLGIGTVHRLFPDKADEEAASLLTAEEGWRVILRYKSDPHKPYDNFALCATQEEAYRYINKPSLYHDVQVLHPRGWQGWQPQATDYRERRSAQSEGPRWGALTDDELKATAQDLGILGCESLSRRELIQAISNHSHPEKSQAVVLGVSKKWWQFWKWAGEPKKRDAIKEKYGSTPASADRKRRNLPADEKYAPMTAKLAAGPDLDRQRPFESIGRIWTAIIQERQDLYPPHVLRAFCLKAIDNLPTLPFDTDTQCGAAWGMIGDLLYKTLHPEWQSDVSRMTACPQARRCFEEALRFDPNSQLTKMRLEHV
jgi:hypothetical protein